MPEKSWIERLSARGDSWFRASKLEKEGRFEEASRYYVEEAEKQKGKNLGMAAVSYLAAAKCLVKAGRKDEAVKLFRLAASHYEKYAEEVLAVSPNSALWGYQMASKSYMWAEDYKKADELLEKAKSLMDKLELKPVKVEISGDVPLFKTYKSRRGKEDSK